MKVITKILAIALLVNMSLNGVFAQEIDQAKITQQFYTAYVANSKPAWKISLAQLENNKAKSLQLMLAKGFYGAAGTAMGNQYEDLTEAMLDKAEAVAKKILAKDKKSPEANALLSVVYGLKIGLSPMKGMYLGGKSSSAAKKGIELAPENAFTNYVMGSYLFYTPSMFGGDAKACLKYLEKSKGIYEKETQTQNWEYMNLLTLLGQAYHNQKDYAKAKAIYETALQIAPNFGYVKMYLLPLTEKAIKA